MTTPAPVAEPVLVQDEQIDNPPVQKAKSPAKVRIEEGKPKTGSQSEPRPGRPSSANQKDKVNGKPNWVSTSQFADSRFLFLSSLFHQRN